MSDLVEKMRRSREAFNRRDFDAVVADSDPDIEFVPLTAAVDGVVYRGRDQYRAALDQFVIDWEQFELVTDEIRDLGNGVVLALGTWNAKVRSTGVELRDQPGAWIAVFRDGLAVLAQTYTDQQAGIAAAHELAATPR